MKKIAMFPAVVALFLVSCDSSRVMTSTVDDVYVSPKEEKEKQRQLAVEEAKRDAMARAERDQEEKAANDKRQAEQAKEANNAYYQDPEYNSEDYYDYAYASRINRFHNPMGLGYYDAYYTNMYTYNQNPAFYGTSIYSTWGGMPSQQFNSISVGISSGWGYGMGYGYGMGFGMGYNRYCPGFYDPFYDPWCPYPSYYGGWGYGYNSFGYMNGYNNGYWNGYRNGMYQYGMMNYYNSLDVNSLPVNAPRGSNMGGGRRSDNSGAASESGSYQRRYLESVSEQRSNAPRFDHSSRRVMRDQPNESATPARSSNPENRQMESPAPAERNTRNTGRSRNENRVQRSQQQQQQQPAQQTPQRRSEPVITPGSGGSGGGSAPAPRNSGGGGSSRRPR